LIADAVSRWGAPTLGRTVVIGCAAGLLILSASVLAVFFRPHPNPITHHHAHPCVSRLPSLCSGKRSGVSRFTL
jgi:hypothetical protein